MPTPKLVPLVEAGMDKKDIYDVLHEYLDSYAGKIKSIILGCTHYPILENQIKDILPDIEYISSSDAVCKNVRDVLIKNNLLNLNKNKFIKIYTTGRVDEF
ncbi:MAG: hypothetical protein ACLRQF_24495 [Thomasclavelia ramosa]